jgi:hypothetical protein
MWIIIPSTSLTTKKNQLTKHPMMVTALHNHPMLVEALHNHPMLVAALHYQPALLVAVALMLAAFSLSIFSSTGTPP